MTPPADERRTRRPAWAGRNYTLLTAAAIATNLGSQGALIASAFAVLESGGGAGDVGLVAAARTIPLVLFLLVGGALADRLPRHRVMVAANALNCVSQAAFAALVLTGDPRLWQMIPLATALAGPTESAFGRTPALWGCAALIVLLTAAVLAVPDVRRLTRRTETEKIAAGPADSPASPAPSADAEGTVGRAG